MAKLLELKGNIYGLLTVTNFVGKDKHHKTLWECKCQCGKVIIVNGSNLTKGNSTSCGCARISKITKHGGSRNRSYNTWRGMMRRCYNVKDKAYSKYGGKGIEVCKEWHNYEMFRESVGEPEDGQSLDRINPYGNYEQSNCRWASAAIQSRNIRVKSCNKSGYTGVYQLKNGLWRAQITVNRKTVVTKMLLSKEEAIEARKNLELTHWGNV